MLPPKRRTGNPLGGVQQGAPPTSPTMNINDASMWPSEKEWPYPIMNSARVLDLFLRMRAATAR